LENIKVQQEQNCFGNDVAFMKEHTDILVLTAPDNPNAKIAVAPGYQARIMTSSAAGDDGAGFGWINREVIADGSRRDQINVFGGEDRYWLGPEGGQFSIYFDPGADFDFAQWRVPAPIDWCEWDAVGSATASEATFEKTFEIINWSDNTLKMTAGRTIRVMSKEALQSALRIDCRGLNAVGYETENFLTNCGEAKWTKENGLLSIWILGMFNPAPETTVVIPFKAGCECELGPTVNDTYFGKIPANRLKIDHEKGVLFFSGDGEYRSKLGISPARAKDVMGSYDADGGSLTIVKYSLPEIPGEYVNAMWEYQEKPFEGDVVNAYNDGPAEPGAKPLGPFYELESSSPALAPEPGEKMIHTHQTFHFSGDKEKLDTIARQLLGTSLKEIANSLK
jgi:Family of unknown function (DUF6786)